MLRAPVQSTLLLSGRRAASRVSPPRAPPSRRPLSDKSTKKKPTTAAEKAPAEKAAAAEEAPPAKDARKKIQTRVDPHQLASEFIKASPETRPQGTESLASLTPEQRMRNFGTAAALLGFSGWVWWYSMNSVGRPEGGLESLEEEAAEARVAAQRRGEIEREAEELADLEVTAANIEGGIGGGVEVAVAAPREIAQEEEDRSLAVAAKKEGDKPRRALWKRVVFFWRRE